MNNTTFSKLMLARAATILVTGLVTADATAGSCSAGSADAKAGSASYAAGHDIVDIAASAGVFDTLVAAVKAAGLADTLKGDGPFTVFAPTDEAFARLPEGTLASLLKPENKNQLAAILTYHVVPGRLTAKDVIKASGMKTLNGQRLDFSAVHGSVKIDKASVVKSDIMASNGVIHVIDRVMLPAGDSIVGTAAKAGSFNTLLTAAKHAGLADLLDQDGPFTVFAPTDEAFAKLPEGTVASLLKPENREQLKAILTYHVVPGRVHSDQVLETGRATTAHGGTITIALRDGAAYANDARILSTDIDASNGVIHVIDTVILPPAS